MSTGTWPSKPSTDVLPGQFLNSQTPSILRNLRVCRRSSCILLWLVSTKSGGMTLLVAFLRSSVEMAQSATSMAGVAFPWWLHTTCVLHDPPRCKVQVQIVYVTSTQFIVLQA